MRKKSIKKHIFLLPTLAFFLFSKISLAVDKELSFIITSGTGVFLHACDAGLRHENAGELDKMLFSVSTDQYLPDDHIGILSYKKELAAPISGELIASNDITRKLNLNWDVDRALNTRKLSKLVFILQSKNYGASYFVDICYANISNFATNTGIPRTELSATIDFDNVYDDSQYRVKSALEARALIVCTERSTDRNGGNVWRNTFKTISSGEYTRLNTGTTILFENFSVKLQSATVTSCRVRYEFREASRGIRLPRKNGLTDKVKINTRTEAVKIIEGS